MINETLVNIVDLSFRYRKNVPLLSHINLQLKSGTINGLLGKNGEGKSTMLKLMSGLLFPKEGELNVMGYNPCQRKYDFLQSVFLLPEELPQITTTIGNYEKIYAPFYPAFDHEQFDFYLKEFDVFTKDTAMDKMSLGQRKKVLISFALATNTKLLLMDEPTNGLDIPSKTIFRKLVAGKIDEDKCLVISTHQVRDLESLIDNIIIIDEHEIIVDENVDNITKKLVFKIEDSNIVNESVIYSLDTVKGYFQVKENLNSEESKLDIEMLFNAVLSNKKRIQEIFRKP